jgi:hypothetical protein
MSGDHLDALIEAVLKTDTITTGRQKRLAWERLEQRAAHQTIWPSLIEPEPSLGRTLRFAWGRVCRCVSILLIDEGSYERARRERHTLYLCPITSASSPNTMLEFSPHMRPQM